MIIFKIQIYQNIIYYAKIISSNYFLIIAYLDTTQDNVFALDYRNITTQFYPFAVADIPTVGKCVADALDIMIENGVNPKKIHIIGHSLGAELGGSIGRQMKFRIGRITGIIYKYFISLYVLNNFKLEL